MEYIIITIAFFILMLVYFKIADRYNIIDKPNHRSAHTEITLRGGGIIFPIAYLFFMGFQFFFKTDVFNDPTTPNYFIFGLGLLLICFISFVDDIIDLSTKIRLVFHFVAVTLLLYFLNAFQLFPVWIIPVFYILIIGILNAYNFMDGINGISGMFSLVVLVAIWFVNENVAAFVNPDFIIYPIIASVVFLIFNFRKKAKCFLGDIGSMGLAFWIIALLSLLMIETGEIKWILFLLVYGVDTILTLVERLLLKENIFDAHRRHLYQLFANEKKVDHRIVSAVYALVQAVVCTLVIVTTIKSNWQLLLIILPLVVFYIVLKLKIKRNYLV